MAKERIKTIGMCVGKKDYDFVQKKVATLNEGKALDKQMSVSSFTKKVFTYGLRVCEHNDFDFKKCDKFIKDLSFIDKE